MHRRIALSFVGCACCQSVCPQVFPKPSSNVQVAAVARGCGIEPSGGPRPTKLVRCGVPKLDANIDIELAFLRKVFHVTPTFYFGQDSASDPLARTYRGAEANDQATIIIGVNFIQREILLNPTHWELALIGVLAHEWAHALQYDSRLQDRQFMWETHADFMAGWYLGVKRAVGNQLSQPLPLAKSLFEKGVSSDFFNPDTHGSAQVRVRAMLKGYDLGLNGDRGVALTVHDAANVGYMHASQEAAR